MNNKWGLIVTSVLCLLTPACSISLGSQTEAVPMTNIGLFRPGGVHMNPVVPGGLTAEHTRDLEAKGWKPSITKTLLKDVDVGFADPEMPGGFTFRKVDIPAGTAYYYNPADGRAILSSCGNPTCWRWLVDAP